MGRYNSSKTRVQPVFDALLKHDLSVWLPALWRMAAMMRERVIPPPASVGPLRPGKIYERTLPPSTAFLRWMVQNPAKLTPLPAPNYGASEGGVASERRAAPFGSDPQLRAATLREAMAAIEKKRGQGSGQEWWAFEGFTHVDACFDTAECLLIIEGKRTEAVSPSTRWFAKRNQLWRNVEVVGELAGERLFGVILAVESAAAGEAALQDAERSHDDSYPHLSIDQKRELDRHLLGFAVWSEMVSAFNLPPSVLLDT
jgi:hypothetical protein